MCGVCVWCGFGVGLGDGLGGGLGDVLVGLGDGLGGGVGVLLGDGLTGGVGVGPTVRCCRGCTSAAVHLQFEVTRRL